MWHLPKPYHVNDLMFSYIYFLFCNFPDQYIIFLKIPRRIPRTKCSGCVTLGPFMPPPRHPSRSYVQSYPEWKEQCEVSSCLHFATDWAAHWSDSCPDTEWLSGPVGCLPPGNTLVCLQSTEENVMTLLLVRCEHMQISESILPIMLKNELVLKADFFVLAKKKGKLKQKHFKAVPAD